MCPECAIATDFHEHRWFNPACLYCWARSIQLVGTFAWTKTRIYEERQRMLNEAEKAGFSRAEVRELAKGATALPTQAMPDSDPLKKRRKKSSGAAALTGG